MDEKKSMILAGGLWASTSKSGKKMLTGSMGRVRLVILPNEKREHEGQPTHFLFFAESNQRPGETKNETKSAPQTGEAIDERHLWREEEADPV